MRSELTYLIVGSGYRAELYARIALRHPEMFRAAFLCRTEEKATMLRRKLGVDAMTSAEAGERFQPDFVVVAVNKESIADLAAEWAERGFAVLAETPAGASLEQLLRLWELSRTRGVRISVAEQYHRYPELAAGLDAVARGRIGTPYSAYLSLAHDYHAASLLRRMLLADGEAYSLRGERVTNQVVETDSRYGPITDGRVAGRAREVISVTFASGKRAVYDFSDVQYRSFIRSRHLTVRGDRGEWTDRLLLYLDEQDRPRREYLKPWIGQAYRRLDTPALQALRQEHGPELRLESAQDEYAAGTMLLDMGNYVKGGPEPYPLREALDDAYFWLLMRQAAAAPWTEAQSQRMPWNTQYQG